MVTCIGVVSHHKLVSRDLGIRMLSVSVDGQPISFPAPLQDHVSSRHRVNRAHLAETSLSKACEVLR